MTRSEPSGKESSSGARPGGARREPGRGGSGRRGSAAWLFGCVGAAMLATMCAGISYLLVQAFAVPGPPPADAPWMPMDVEETKRRGAEVVALIESERAVGGEAPDDLEIDASMLPLVGDKAWDYRVFEDGQRFTLTVIDPETSERLQYDSAIGRWLFTR